MKGRHARGLTLSLSLSSSLRTLGVTKTQRGLALAGTGEEGGAVVSLRSLERRAGDIRGGDGLFPKGHPWYGSYREQGQILALILGARLSLMRGQPHDAAEKMKAAVAVQSAFPYMEPEVFYLPTRQCLGAVLRSLGDLESAEAVLSEDLAEHPNSKQRCCELGFC